MYRGRALIIATSQYDRDPELTPLPSVVEDAAGLTKVLADPRIGNFLVTTCLESAAHECSERIEDFFSQGTREELQLLYISGHGVKDAEGELHFAVKNTLTRLLGATAVSSSFIKRAAKRSRARGIVTILDTCFSGAFLGHDPKAAQVGVGHHFREGRGRVVITASDSFQHALGGQTGDSRHRPSLFSSHVIRGLASGEADVDGNGEVSSKDLYDYVQGRMQHEGSSQRPQRWDFKQDGPDLVLASNPHPPMAVLPPEVVVLAQQQLPSLRLDAIVRLRVLLSSDSPPMVLAARALLDRLQTDPDPAVAGAAATVLQRPSSPAPAPLPRFNPPRPMTHEAPAPPVSRQPPAREAPEPPLPHGRQPGASGKAVPPQVQTARGQAQFSGSVQVKYASALWRAAASGAVVLIVAVVILSWENHESAVPTGARTDRSLAGLPAVAVAPGFRDKRSSRTKPGDSLTVCLTEQPVVSAGAKVSLKAWATTPNGLAAAAPRFDWTVDAGRIEGTGGEVRWDLSSVKVDPVLQVRKVTATVKTAVSQESCSVEVFVGAKGREQGILRRGPEDLISARHYLLPGSAEANGFGLYSYLMFSAPPKDAEEKARYLKTIESCLTQLQDVDDYLSSHVRPKSLNATYIPLKSVPSQGKSNEEWAANALAVYDYAAAQILLSKVNHRHQNGPYLVSVLTPLTEAPNTTHLWEDLTGVAPDQAYDWMKRFTYLSAQQRTWTDASLELFGLRLRNLIAVGGKVEYVKG